MNKNLEGKTALVTGGGRGIGAGIARELAAAGARVAVAARTRAQVDEIARLWWRVFSALLFVQVIQAVLVEVGLQLLRHTDWLGPVSDLTSGLVLITLLYLLFKLPSAAYHWAFRQRISQHPVVQGTVATVRAVAAAVAA
jgi:NAD(P)-dependent dehydrogenase (short-subunit alcohol dehydrogenase family)